jgi:hypothetical protein
MATEKRRAAGSRTPFFTTFFTLYFTLFFTSSFTPHK